MVKLLIALVVVVATVHCLPNYDVRQYVRPNTPENMERLRHLSKDDLAELFSGQYQGDIVISPEQLADYRGEKRGKTGLRDTDYRWPDNTIPYEIVESDFTASQIEWIHLGAEKLMDVTCMKFVKYDPRVHKDYITIQGQNSGCWSYVGRQGGQQFLNLTPNNREVGCFRLYTIVHEFLHALGFFHMQSATERDEYVQIVWDKIQSGTETNFDAYGSDYITNYNVEYDYGSVMHYPKTAFSIDGSDTIIPQKDLGGLTMGQRLRLSTKDIARVNRMYCNESVRPPPRLTAPEIIQAVFDHLRQKLGNILGNLRQP